MKTSTERTSSAVQPAQVSRERARVPYMPPVVPTPAPLRRLSLGASRLTWIASDAVALAAAVFATYWLRFSSAWFPTPQGIPDLSSYAWSLLVVVPVGLACLQSRGLYRAFRFSSPLRDLDQGGRAVVMLCVLLAAVGFFYREFSYSRTFLAGFAVVATLSIVVLRRFASGVQRWLHRRGVGVVRVGFAGGGPVASRLQRALESRSGWGHEVAGCLEGLDWGTGHDSAERARRPGRVRSFLRTARVDRLMVTDPELSHGERVDLVEVCHGEGVVCEFVPDLFEVMVGRLRVEELDGIPLVGSKLHPLGRWDRFKKRTLDLVVSGISLVALAPLFGFLALLVRWDSKGPVLYRQARLGRDGRTFDILKFRSMPVETEGESGPVRATKSDDRPTRVGRILRRTSLDELPQLWNVLRGEMSLVGPRPERSFFVDHYQEEIPRYLERHGVKSGLTGWAQVNGLRGNTSIEERTRYDIWYVENWSLFLDLKILVLTAVRFLFQEEAY